MWLRTSCSGPCQVQMDYDGGWQLRICRWLSWMALAGVGFVLVRLIVRRPFPQDKVGLAA